MTQATQERPTMMMEQMTETWLQGISNVCWAQDQIEKIVNSMLEQGRVTREEGRRIAERMARQVRDNQESMQKWVESTTQMSMAAFRMPTHIQVDELNRKIDELTRKVEALNKK